MKKRTLYVVIILLFVWSTSSCLALSEEQKKDYGVLASAVTFSSDKVIGEYGNAIPDDFSGQKLMALVKGRIPDDYFAEMNKYCIDVKPRKSYYLLLVEECQSKKVIMFDYSCTTQIDGPVLLDPRKYDVDKIESYDRCRPNAKTD